VPSTSLRDRNAVLPSLVVGEERMTIAIASPEARSFRFDDKQTWTEAPAPAAPPLDLTASDGTGLVLAQLSARAVIDDPLAFTEFQLTFQNPEPRPPAASIARRRRGSSGGGPSARAISRAR